MCGAFCAALLFGQAARAEDALPWAQAEKTVNAAQAAAHQGGARKIAPYVPALEQALREGGQLNPPIFRQGETLYVLTDGGAESATTGKPVQSPYPLASLLLGTYYNELHKPAEALRVLDQGLALPKVNSKIDIDIGYHAARLIIARGLALSQLKQWPDVVEDYDRGLRLPNLPNAQRAVLHRGRGFALTELTRLDEAEAAYQASLEIEPDNAQAQKELQYIAGLRANSGATKP